MNRWISLFLMVFAMLLSGCSDSAAPANGKLPVTAGLPPVAFLVRSVGGEKVDCRSILPEGRSPHEYSPGPGDVRTMAAGKIFFSTGMLFEKSLEKAIAGSSVALVNVGSGVKRIPFDGAPCHDEHAETHGEKDHAKSPDVHKGHAHAAHSHQHTGEWDPHIWLSLDNAAMMTGNIADALCKADPEHAAFYRKNAEALTSRIAAEKAAILKDLAPYKNCEFYVYHPAFGYYAKMVGLKQVAIEAGGREATAAHLREIICHARENNVHTVFVQPQYNEATARALSDAIQGKVAPLDALAPDLLANLRYMTDNIKAGFLVPAKAVKP